MYVQYLKNSFPAPTTVKNYLSGAKTWITEHGGNPSFFSSIEYHQLSTGLTKRYQHVPQRATPLDWTHIQLIVQFLDATPRVPVGVKLCILIAYHTFLRASNLLSPTLATWGGPHTLSVRDLTLSDEGLQVSVHSTKTKSDPVPLKTIIPWASNSVTCPVAAWFKYLTKIKPWPLGPAFLTDDGLPLTPRHVTGFMRLSLKDCKDIIPSRISLHSLHRGAVHSAVRQGIPRDVIKQQGKWRSDSGLAPYLL